MGNVAWREHDGVSPGRYNYVDGILLEMDVSPANVAYTPDEDGVTYIGGPYRLAGRNGSHGATHNNEFAVFFGDRLNLTTLQPQQHWHQIRFDHNRTDVTASYNIRITGIEMRYFREIAGAVLEFDIIGRAKLGAATTALSGVEVTPWSIGSADLPVTVGYGTYTDQALNLDLNIQDYHYLIGFRLIPVAAASIPGGLAVGQITLTYQKFTVE